MYVLSKFSKGLPNDGISFVRFLNNVHALPAKCVPCIRRNIYRTYQSSSTYVRTSGYHCILRLSLMSLVQELRQSNSRTFGVDDPRAQIRYIQHDIFGSPESLDTQYTILVPPKKDVHVMQYLLSREALLGYAEWSAPLHILPGRWTVEDLLNEADRGGYEASMPNWL